MITRSERSAEVDLEAEARQALPDRPVERRLVGLGRMLVERPLEGVAEVGERLGALLDEVDVLAVALLGLVAPRLLVAALRLLAGLDQAGVVVREELQLTRDQVAEAVPAEDQRSSS
jgi:hypothetical protein